MSLSIIDIAYTPCGREVLIERVQRIGLSNINVQLNITGVMNIAQRIYSALALCCSSTGRMCNILCATHC